MKNLEYLDFNSIDCIIYQSIMNQAGYKYLVLNQGNKVIHHWKSATFGGD